MTLVNMLTHSLKIKNIFGLTNQKPNPEAEPQGIL